nr:MAG: hypothetical protein DIU78_06765 [Pseudomonadota bacterium]
MPPPQVESARFHGVTPSRPLGLSGLFVSGSTFPSGGDAEEVSGHEAPKPNATSMRIVLRSPSRAPVEPFPSSTETRLSRTRRAKRTAA